MAFYNCQVYGFLQLSSIWLSTTVKYMAFYNCQVYDFLQLSIIWLSTTVKYMAFYNCQIIKDNVDIKGKYEDIFKQSVPSDLVNTLVKIEQFRKENL